MGCYLAYKLLTKHGAKVALFEGRLLNRPQVVRIPFAIAKDLPADIKNELWCDSTTQERIFNHHSITAIDFWPKPGYLYWPWFSIGSFQTAMINFLQTNSEYKERFFFVPQAQDIAELNPSVALKAIYPDAELPDAAAIFCTCGNYAKSFRDQLGLQLGKTTELKGHGIYLIYQNDQIENYWRDGKPISYSELGEKGISYAAANNRSLDVQLYTYPAGKLADVFLQMPQSFMEYSQYRSMDQALTMTGEGLPEDARQWFETYKAVLVEQMRFFNLRLPQEPSKIRVFYAARSEYYWDAVTSDMEIPINCPLFFLGDSAGSTDYKFGLSVGRGLLAAQQLSSVLTRHPHDLSFLRANYQAYWNEVIKREFNKGPTLTAEPWIQYQYLVKGRKVIYPQGNAITYRDDKDYPFYLNDYQDLVPGYANTSEASAVLYINTRAVRENIANITALAHGLNGSKIVAVVKGDGYGLGAKLMAELAISAGVKFLGVAKLREAIALREAGFVPPIRLMVFEPPLLHDLSSYAKHNIELVLPSSPNGESVDILANWLHAHQALSATGLKVHIMVDTGLRREGGFSANTPEAVWQTIAAMQRFSKSGLFLAGIATHLACYRCTDYNGEEVIDYRALQLQRLRAVLEYLLSKGIKIPMVHVGGGLGLLAEHWPKYFADLADKHSIQLYTRVGHGMYGMELAEELNPASPQLRPTVEMNLQVRNIFHVEAGEPVSYGGYWRAPQQGTWVATLSGGWDEGIPRTVKTLGLWDEGMSVCINGELYPAIGTINMNAMMVNLGTETSVRPGDRAVIFGWQPHHPKLRDLAALSGQISPSVTVNIPAYIPRIAVED